MSLDEKSDPHVFIAAGYRARHHGQTSEAKGIFLEAVRLSRQAVEEGDGATLEVLSEALSGLGRIERDLAEIPASLEHYRESVDLVRRLNQPLKLAHTIRHIADIQRKNGDFEQAAANYDEALLLYRDHEDTAPLDVANTLRGFALLVGDRGRTSTAISYWQEARALYMEAGVQTGLDLQPGIDESDRNIARLSALESHD